MKGSGELLRQFPTFPVDAQRFYLEIRPLRWQDTRWKLLDGLQGINGELPDS
jgi:hypothetical protein